MTLHTIINGRHVTIDRFRTGIAPRSWVWVGSVDTDPDALVPGVSTADGLRQVLAGLDRITSKEVG